MSHFDEVSSPFKCHFSALMWQHGNLKKSSWTHRKQQQKNGKSRLTLLEGDEFETVLSVPILLSDTVIGPEEMSTSSSSLSTRITDSSLLIFV